MTLSVLDTNLPMQEPMTPLYQTFLPKTGVLNGNYIITKSLPNFCQNFNKTLIETPVLGKNV